MENVQDPIFSTIHSNLLHAKNHVILVQIIATKERVSSKLTRLLKSYILLYRQLVFLNKERSSLLISLSIFYFLRLHSVFDKYTLFIHILAWCLQGNSHHFLASSSQGRVCLNRTKSTLSKSWPQRDVIREFPEGKDEWDQSKRTLIMELDKDSKEQNSGPFI